jgi:hypothetical protein
MAHALTLTELPGELAVCQLPTDAAIPDWTWGGPVSAVVRTADELSVVCAADAVPGGVTCRRGWRCLRVEGPFDLGQVGVMAALTGPLAAAGVSLFALSTYDTDYLLVQGDDLPRAAEALRRAGHGVATR